MAIFSLAELNHRQRFVLYFLEAGKVLLDRDVGAPPSLPIRRVNFSERFALELESSEAEYATEHTVLAFSLRLAVRREIVIAENLEPALALFNDDERTTIWTRLFSEVIDVPGMVLAAIRTGSLLAPPRRVTDRYSWSVRGQRGALASDDQLLREVIER